jgi:hypothetical protein
MTEIKIISTPIEIIQHIDQRLASDRFAHIQIRSSENKGVFERWVAQIRVWYDPNICGCKKKGLSEDTVVNQYKQFANLSAEEKAKAYRIMGCEVEFKYGDEFITKIP